MRHLAFILAILALGVWAYAGQVCDQVSCTSTSGGATVDTAAGTAVIGSATVRLFDPATTAYVYDEFTSGGNPTSSVPSSGLNTMGQLGWYMTNASYTPSQPASEADHVGILSFGVNNTRNCLHAKEGGADLLPAETFDSTWWIRADNADTNTEYFFGFISGCADVGSHVNAIGIGKAFADTEWKYFTRAASVGTGTTTGITVGTGWIKFRLRRVDASTIGFTVNNGTELTTTSNIPTAAIYTVAQIGANTTANKSVDLDFYDMAITEFSR